MSKITKFAKGQPCQVRLPTHCNWNNETVVFAHLNGAGMGMKHKDLFGAFACSSCHDVLDGRKKSGLTQDDKRLYHYEAMHRTQQILLDNGLIKI